MGGVSGVSGRALIAVECMTDKQLVGGDQGGGGFVASVPGGLEVCPVLETRQRSGRVGRPEGGR